MCASKRALILAPGLRRNTHLTEQIARQTSDAHQALCVGASRLGCMIGGGSLQLSAAMVFPAPAAGRCERLDLIGQR
jgi:hypothetical protein